MKSELEKAVKDNATKASNASTADEAVKYSQAALNAAHALVTVTNIK